jgi:guanylate kinase|tara:strand:+ start:328 stop:726 length:399 start_codon:yes stop_codon:yes gene_type:complete
MCETCYVDYAAETDMLRCTIEHLKMAISSWTHREQKRDAQDYYFSDRLEDAEEEVAELKARIKKNPLIEWFSVDGHWPPIGERVFVYVEESETHEGSDVCIGIEDEHIMWKDFNDEDEITHWMPIPTERGFI